MSEKTPGTEGAEGEASEQPKSQADKVADVENSTQSSESAKAALNKGPVSPSLSQRQFTARLDADSELSEKEKARQRKINKLSRGEVSDMSSAEFVSAMQIPFKRLLSHVKPYKKRFILGIIFGVIAGVFNGLMLFGMRFTFETLLPKGPRTEVVVEGATPEATKKIENGDIQISTRGEYKGEAWQSPLNLEENQAGELVAGLDSDGEGKTFTIPIINKVVTIPKPDLSNRTGIWVALAVSSIIPLMMFIRGMLNYLNQYFLISVGNNVLYDLRDKTFSRLVNHSLRFYSQQKTGELIQTVFNQTRMAQTAGTQLASDLVKHPISIISIVGILIYWDWKFAIASLVVFPLCILPVLAISKKVRSAGGKEEEEAGMLMVAMQETFAGIRTVKSYAREDYERNRFNNASAKMMAFIMRWRKAMEITGPMVETVASIGIALGLIYAKYTGMSAAQFLLMFAALIGLYPHAKALGRLQIELQKCVVASTKVFEIIDTDYEIDDAPDAIEVEDSEGAIEFKDVSFAYKKGIPALRDIDLYLEPGKTYALVGPSGAGKSSLFSLIMRFYDPDTGGITLDGVDLRDIKQTSLRDQIGIVNQETFLFHDSIENNIRYGRLDANRIDIVEAARQANAHDFIIEQENSYETIVGDKGSTLSGGQQQRISIARTILRDAPILLLDEAYSALDTESEKVIQEAIETLSEGKTVIAIAHRLSTVLDADQIIVMNNGWIEDRGTHAELLKDCALYQRLYALQFEGEARVTSAEKTKKADKAKEGKKNETLLVSKPAKADKDSSLAKESKSKKSAV